MPPHNIFDGDCQSATSMSQIFNSLLTSSMSALAPMCNDSVEPRVYSPTYPMNMDAEPMDTDDQSSPPQTTMSPRSRTVSRPPKSPRQVSVSTSPDPRRPPLNPIKPKATTGPRGRRKVNLSINVPPPSSDPHQVHIIPGYDGQPPPLISCSKNVELRRKSLSERHFFRPVSGDSEDSVMGMNQ